MTGSWRERQQELLRIDEKQIFFIGGAPRSGTTWLQRILDGHPDVCCRGEGLFAKELAVPLDRLMQARARAIETKNRTVFSHSGGYLLPTSEDTEFLVGSAILLALRQQAAGRACRAIGEKTPENVFLFPRLKRLFPRAKLICIARDPRDVLSSAWHFFHQPQPDEDEVSAKTAFIRLALPSLDDGARVMLALAEQQPSECMIVTYEALRRSPLASVGGIFRFLGVDDRDAIVETCVSLADFAAMTGGREAGVERRELFLRKGIVGDWRSTLTPEMNALVLETLDWMFPSFGWER